MIDASVLIPSYDNRATLLACIEHLKAQTHPAERFEAIVVLDGSTDGSAEALRRCETSFALKVVEQSNRGRAAALNRAAAEARGPLLIVIDADILPNPGFIASHVAAHADADVVIGPIPLSDRSPRSFLTDGVKHWADNHARRMRERSGGFSCSEIYGANLSIPLAVFRRLGGYREDLRRTEDFHLGKKILDAGCRVAYCPEAVAEQIYDKTFFAWCDDFYVDGRSHAGLIREFPEETPNLTIGHYHPVSTVRGMLRPLVIHRPRLGGFVILCAKLVLESCRRLGLRWKVLSMIQGVVGDALFWRGVHDELGDRERFEALIESDGRTAG